MLHEILLSLSGHPSPLLDPSATNSSPLMSPPERALLSTLSHLGTMHQKLLLHTKECVHHPSPICRSISHHISAVHLRSFQSHILRVESSILRLSPDAVGAYNIVPLTYLVREFSPWIRMMEWLLEVVEFMIRGTGRGSGRKCSGKLVLETLRAGLRTGYQDLEEVNRGLVEVAERAWLKNCVGWVCFGILPGLGKEDFGIEEVRDEEGNVVDYQCDKELLPSFVTTPTAASLLFIGRSLNHIRTKGMAGSTSPDMTLLSSHLQQLSSLSFPINSAHFSQVIASIRLSLSQSTLQKLLPLSKAIEVLALLREFFLLGRGEFAMALINEADEKIRSRWRRADNLSYEKREGLSNIVLKGGEVSAILSRTWAALGLLQGHHASEDEDEDELLELARDLVQLNISRTSTMTPVPSSLNASHSIPSIATTPFRNLLLSVATTLTLRIPSPLDLFLTPTDIQTYSAINAYLLSIRRAHLRLTDLWKITSFRREHPAPPGPPYGSSSVGREKVQTLRQRAKARSKVMRSVWATSSAAVFFLGETEAYLQGEVVQGAWSEFRTWLVGGDTSASSRPQSSRRENTTIVSEDSDDDLILAAGLAPNPSSPSSPSQKTQPHDPQTLTAAHNLYLSTLLSSLLLTHTHQPFTSALYTLLLQIDHLVALVHRMHSIWHSMDLEADEGVVDAFSDFGKEEGEVRKELRDVGDRVRRGVEGVVGILGGLVEGIGMGEEGDDLAGGGSVEFEPGVGGGEEGIGIGEGGYRPKRVGRVDRLLMKLDFGGWFEGGNDEKIGEEGDV